MDNDQELLDSYNEEGTIDELIKMNESKQDMEELESFDQVLSEDPMTVGRAFAGRRGAGIRHNPESKIIALKNLIESSEIFETDKEFLQSVIDGVLVEKKAKIEQDKFKLESERAAKIEQEKFKLESEKARLNLKN
ncbi:hypothetical protein TNCV_1196901 [Trichonephila clavipes]|uniref:Uncharacterized protein n=1 Tax=Trichonephila clavipes TaxID=2585209 RepID=A0A8X6S3K6_TRICX|nr:hypothetical protein TNCV_1196901 [Trichonephila clavipes]